MDKFQSRAAIKLLYLKGMQPKEILFDLSSTLGEQAPSYRVVKFWVAEFKRGRQSTNDELRPGRPVDVSTPEMVKLVHKTVLSDRRMTLEQIADIVRISPSTVRHILVEVLLMKKLSRLTLGSPNVERAKQAKSPRHFANSFGSIRRGSSQFFGAIGYSG